MELFGSAAVRFTHSNSVGKLLGFSEEYSAHTNTLFFTGELFPRFYGKISVHLNCLQNSFNNQQESSFIYSFTRETGTRLTTCIAYPNILVYFPLKDKINDFKVEIKDENNTNLCFDDFHLKFHIKK